MINKRSAVLGLVAAAASAVLLADPATAQGAPTATQVQAKTLSSGTSFGVADRPIPLIGHRRHHRRHHRRRHWRHHRRWGHRRHWGHRRRWGWGHSNSNSNRNTNTNTNVNINRNVIDIDP